MKTRIFNITAIVMMLAGSISSCATKSNMNNSENHNCTSCEDKTIIRALKDEPAYIRKTCFEFLERGQIDTFFFELAYNHSKEYYDRSLFSCSEIPERYRKEGLSVKISGNVTNCKEAAICGADFIPVFELTSIVENPICPCEGREILKVLKDEPAFVMKTCFEHAGRVDTYYFVLVNDHPDFFGQTLLPCGEIPEQYRKEGMSVRISGNVTSCVETGGCIEPNVRLTPIHYIEIKFINNN